MRKFHRNLALLLFAAAAAISPVRAQSSTPVIFFTDLQSGPNTGGENNNGAILSIFGKNFGATQGNSTVTVGGGAVAVYKTWCSACSATGLDMIQAAIGTNAKTGTVSVTVGGISSLCANRDDGCSFTVRSGNLYYISTSGSDSNSGSYSSPWKTVLHAMEGKSVQAGDIVYAENGVGATSDDGKGFGGALSVGTNTGTNQGSSGNPISLVAYPGATATIGSLTTDTVNGDALQFAIRDPGTYNYFTLSGFTVLAPNSAIQNLYDNYWRLINNQFSCANVQSYGCILTSGGSNLRVYGNNMHDVGVYGTSYKLEHIFYFSTNSQHLWFGWNRLGDGVTDTCTSLMIHSTNGAQQYDLHIHDNVIHNDRCTGLNLATIDPSQGPVEVYNNVFYALGHGPQPPDSSFYSPGCLYASGESDTGALGSGTALIYNNTFYDCGGMLGGGVEAGYGVVVIEDQDSDTKINYEFANNVFYPTTAEASYFGTGCCGIGTQQVVSCNNNLFFQGGAAPSVCTSGAVNSNPNVVSVTTPSFQIQSGSPAIGKGTTSVAPAFDIMGNARPSPPSIGAYELSAATVVSSAPNPPTNLQVTVQ